MESKKKLTIEVESNLDDVLKNMDDLKKGFETTQKSIEDTNNALNGVAKATENNTKVTKGLADGFKGVGLATKAMGIGLLMDGLNMLKDVFMKNEKVAKLVGTAMETISIVMNEVVSVVVNVVEKVSKSSNGFEHLGKTIGGLITLSLTPLKMAFFSIKLAIDEVRLGWEQSLFGDNDPKTIKDLNARIEGTKKSISETGKKAIEAGKDVVTNIGGAISEVGQVVDQTIDGVSKISIKGAYERAKVNVELQNSAKLAAKDQEILAQKYDRDAEKLRQIRDDESISIKERIAANEKLGKVLNQQQAAMLKAADLQIAAAQAEVAKNNSLENQLALKDAIANRTGVLADIEGKRSEQKVNEIALEKELKALDESKLENFNKLTIEQKKFDASQEKDALTRLEKEKAILEEEKKIEEERLLNKVNSYKEGTQARQDAENEYYTFKQTKENEIEAKQDAIDQKKYEKEKARLDAIITNDTLTFEARQAAIDAEQIQLDQALANKIISQETYNAAIKTLKKQEDDLETAKMEHKAKVADRIGQIAGQLNATLQAAGVKNKAILAAGIIAEKAAAIGSIIMNTMVANAKAVKDFPATLGQPWVSFNFASMGLGIASTILATTTALKDLGGSGGGGGSAQAPAAAAPAPPQFNVVGNSGVNQLAQTIDAQTQASASRPIQAYVVSGSITTAQSLDRNRVDNATMG